MSPVELDRSGPGNPCDAAKIAILEEIYDAS